MVKQQNKPLGFSELVYLSDYKGEADQTLKEFGRTDLYSTGERRLDEWLGFGFGRKNGYYLMLIAGTTGIGKSSVAIRLLMHSVQKHVPQAWLILEDSPADTLNRLCMMTGDREQTMKDVKCVTLMADTMLESGFRLDNIIQWMEAQSKRGIKLFLIDHLQFAFENAEDIVEKNEILNQRIFMKKLNFLAKREHLTVIMISHVNKNTKAEGLDRILGSSAIVQAATNVIEVFKRKNNTVGMQMLKSRFTELKEDTAVFNRANMKYEFVGVFEGKDTESDSKDADNYPPELRKVEDNEPIYELPF